MRNAAVTCHDLLQCHVRLYLFNQLQTHTRQACNCRSHLTFLQFIHVNVFQVLAVQQKEDRLKKQAKDLQAERDQVHMLIT